LRLLNAAGKTKANVIALLYAVKQLQGKKDRSGDYARLIVAGYTLAHLNKTFLVYLRQILDQSKSRYTENKKDNFFVIGTVTVFIVPMENPENIFGFDSCACIHHKAKILARRQGRVRRIAIRDMRVGDEVFTRSGWRRVLRVLPKGKKPVVHVDKLRCTPDHSILSQEWREAGTLIKSDLIYTASLWRVRAWERVCGLLRQAGESVSYLTGLHTTGIPAERMRVSAAIFSARKLKAVSVIFMWLFGSFITENSRQDMSFIIETASQLIIELKTLKRCPEEKPVFAVRNAVTRINTLKEKLRPSLCVNEEPVRYAGKLSRLLSVLLALPVLRTVRTLREARRYEVYDLTVDGREAHEFFADGILVHNCFVEEIDELTEDKAIEAVRSLSERCRQQIPAFRSPFLCLASTSQGQKGLYRVYNHFKKNGTGFVLLRGRTQDNLFLPKELIADMLRTYTPEEKCLASKERILVRDGSRIYRISLRDIRPGSHVFTRQGWRRVVSVRKNGLKQVGRIAGLLTTEDHKVATGADRWEAAASARTALSYNEQEIIVWTRLQELKTSVKEVLRRLSSMTGKNGTDTQSPEEPAAGSIGAVVRNVLRDVKVICCTYTSGKNTTVHCLTALWYIMRIMITTITVSKILSRCLFFNTRCSTSLEAAFGKRVFQLLKKCTKTIRVIRSLANYAERYSRQNTLTPGSVISINQKYAGRVLSDGGRMTENVIGNDLLPVRTVDRFLDGQAPTLLSALSAVKMSTDLLDQYLKPVLTAAPVFWRRMRLPGFVPGNAVRDTSMREVADVEVEGVHEFVAKGLVVHNCVFMDGEFLAIAKGRVLGDFSWERNYLDYDLDTELRPGESVYIGQDFNTGFSRASAYVVREGVIYCVKYYDFPDPRDAPSVFRYDFPEQRILWIPDVTIKDSFPQFARELRKYGIQIIYRKKNPLVEDTVFLVNKLFYTGRLMICKIARDLAEACALAMRDKDNRIPKGTGPSSPIHAVDTVRYVCAFVCMRDKAFRDIRRIVIDKRASFRSDSDKPVRDLGGGYIQIHPDALYRGKKL
jgi:hypothetical protein